jgi:hypothetical protein
MKFVNYLLPLLETQVTHQRSWPIVVAIEQIKYRQFKGILTLIGVKLE